MLARQWSGETLTTGCYERSGRRYCAFPPFFSWLCAPFFVAWGYRALYIIPVLATLALWGQFWCACRRLHAGPLALAAGLAAVSLASPLTFYGATFWEHTIGIALAFPALARLIAPPARASIVWDACSGLMLGLSTWLRPELLLLAACVALLVVAHPGMIAERRIRFSFVAALAACVAGLLAFNLGISGSWLGFRGLQVTQPTARTSLGAPSLGTPASVLSELLRELVDFYPVVLIVLALAFVQAARTALRAVFVRRDLPIIAMLAVQMGALVLVFRYNGGNRWGPRFHLIVIPATALILVRWLQTLDGPALGGMRIVAALAIAVSLSVGASLLSGQIFTATQKGLDFKRFSGK